MNSGVQIANKGRKSWRPSEEAVVGVCAAIMLRNQNVHMNLLQRIVSLILHNGHASKQVRWNSERGVVGGVF